MAISDYMNPLIIEAIDTNSYTGRAAGEPISVEVNDNFKVKSLIVAIIAEDTTEIESGEALLIGGKWVYMTTTTNTYDTSQLIIRASTYTGETLQMEIEV